MKSIANTKLGALSLVLALLAGPAAAQQNSGFLSDYSKLAPSADNAKVSLWISKDFDFKPYRQVMLDPVEVWMSPSSQYKGASPDALKGMADRFTSSFKKALQPGYQLVNKPGPGVLHIRLAITGVNLVKPDFMPRNVIPIVMVLRAVSGAMEAKDVVLTAEMEVLSPDDKVVAAALATGMGETVKRTRPSLGKMCRGSLTIGRRVCADSSTKRVAWRRSPELATKKPYEVGTLDPRSD